VLLAAAGPATPALAQAFDPTRADIQAFADEVSAKHGFEREALVSLLAQAESRPFILAAIAKPAERTLRWDEYRGKFLVDRRIERGSEVYSERQADLERAQAATGVPVDVILGIVGVETFYGENIGKHRVLDALATLAFDYPPRQKFFRAELEQYLVMAREEGLDPTMPVGSYAGAMGLPQFMPSSFRNFALDGDADGKRDLWNDWADVFLSVGNYLKVHGWRADQPIAVPADATNAKLDGLDDKLALSETVGSLRRRGLKFETTLPESTPAMLVPLTVVDGMEYRVGFANFYAITRYNRSTMYASAVSDLAAAIGARRSGLPLPEVAAPTVPTGPTAPTAPAVAPASTGGWSTTTGGR
jgi:membrane-bound lytic murein transglycosylase B